MSKNSPRNSFTPVSEATYEFSHSRGSHRRHILISGVTGMLARRRLPDRLISDNSRDLIQSIVGLTATLSALVLGLLVASSFAAYSTQKTEIETLSAHAVQLDRTLQRYGPEAGPGRAMVMVRSALVTNYRRYSGEGTGDLDNVTVDQWRPTRSNSPPFSVRSTPTRI
jgi:hypothetical protein